MQAEAVHAHIPVARRREMLRFGFALFLLAEAGIFVTLFSTRFLLAGTQRPAALNQVLAAALTGLMVLSAVPAREAAAAVRRDDRRALRTSLLVTLLLGTLLLAGVAWEWAQLSIPSTGRYGSVFFTALGLHAAHVAAGVVVLAALAIRADLGRVEPGWDFAVEAGVAFWYFVVGVWVALYVVFYLL